MIISITIIIIIIVIIIITIAGRGPTDQKGGSASDRTRSSASHNDFLRRPDLELPLSGIPTRTIYYNIPYHTVP